MKLAKDMGTDARPFFQRLLARMTGVWDTAAAIEILNKVRHLVRADWTEDENIEAILGFLDGRPYRPYHENGVFLLLAAEYGLGADNAEKLLAEHEPFIRANKGEQLYVAAHLAWLFEKQRRSASAAS